MRLITTKNELSSIDEQIIKIESELSQIKKDKPELFENQKPSKEIKKKMDEIDRLRQKKLEKNEQLEKLINCDKGFKSFNLANSNFKHWRSDLVENDEDLDKMIKLFDTQTKPEAKQENMLYELLLKSGLTLTEKVEEKNGYYSIADGKLAIVLKEVNQKIIDEIIKSKPQSCIILDDLFAGNDQLKTNTALQMKDAGVELVTL